MLPLVYGHKFTNVGFRKIKQLMQLSVKSKHERAPSRNELTLISTLRGSMFTSSPVRTALDRHIFEHCHCTEIGRDILLFYS